MKKLIAFTLAEIIIVLGIVGIAAELTIPELVYETNKAQFTSGLKKAYTTWNQALTQMAMDTGSPGDLSGFFDSSDLTTIGDRISAYFKVAKNCKITTNMDCWAKTEAFNYDGKERYNSTINGDTTYYKFRTKDGMSFAINGLYTNCNSDTTYTEITDNNLSKVCADTFFIDINGPKTPNVWGIDIFGFRIAAGRTPTLYPWGGEDEKDMGNYWKDKGHCQTSNKSAMDCSARIIDESWQMKY